MSPLPAKAQGYIEASGVLVVSIFTNTIKTDKESAIILPFPEVDKDELFPMR